jgi:hypothetical protein
MAAQAGGLAKDEVDPPVQVDTHEVIQINARR